MSLLAIRPTAAANQQANHSLPPQPIPLEAADTDNFIIPGWGNGGQPPLASPSAVSC
jgi:hypothetical protein